MSILLMFFESRRTSRRIGRYFVPLVACFALPLLVTCGRDNPTQSRSAVPVRVVVTPETTDLASAGDTIRLNARVLDDGDQQVSQPSVTWHSSDAQVARVSTDGVVTAVGEGSAIITAMARQKTAQARVTVSDPVRRTLAALYRATGGENWKNNENWLSDEPVHRWYGVATASSVGETGATGATVLSARASAAGSALNLPGNGLSGPIPPELGDLVYLRVLDLSGNGLTGSIPPELGNLVRLEVLDLSDNALTGSVPSELGNLSLLETLILNGNAGMSGPLPASFVRLTGLETLDLSGTSLCAPSDAGFEEWLAGVTTRRGLLICGSGADLDRRALTTLYEGTGGANWTNNANWLSQEPLDRWYGVSVTASGRVGSLRLAGNGLSGLIPPELGHLADLTSLDLSGNALFGSIPSELGNLSVLESLMLHGNWGMSGPLPASFVRLTGLETLDLGGTGLCASSDAEFQRWLTGIGNLRIFACGSDADLDRRILSALYYATDGAHWSNNANWLSQAPLDRWYGVSATESGRVVSLRLADNRLSGLIPPELGHLADLTSMDLSGNVLTGSIPPTLGNLSALVSLDLSDNLLSGPIPTILYTLANIQTLDLSGNLFNFTVSSDRAALVALYNATNGSNWLDNDAWLSDRPLGFWNGVSTGANGQFDFNGRVWRLSLGSNKLSGTIPVQLSNLSNLEYLTLHDNQLSGAIPPELGRLTNLTLMLLSRNQLSGSIPSELGNLSNLEYLYLYENQLWGQIPTALGSLSNLIQMRLGNNQLSGVIPPELGNLSNLTHLLLGNNRLSGAIPPELGNLSNLTHLLLGNNRLSGRLPLALSNLNNLVRLNIENTSLCAPTDTTFQAWLDGIQTKGVVNCTPESDDRAALVALYNSTNGPIWHQNRNWLSDRPLGEWYGVTTDANGRVWKLQLGLNWLSGRLPPELGSLSNLTSLVLSDNRLSGRLPPELGSLSNLEVLSLSNNQLSDRLPPELGSLSNLEVLSISNNRLSGMLPPELGSLSNLIGLYLGGNQLSGTIPVQLGNLSNLEELSFSKNQLSGRVPSALGNLSNLTSLYLDNNQLSGRLPSALINLTNLDRLYLSNTGLCAPTDAAFQAWLGGIRTKRGVVYCTLEPDDYSALEALYNATDGMNWEKTRTG